MSETTPGNNGTAVEEFKTCRAEIKYETEVLAARLNSYIVSQSFLVSAFAVSMGNLNPKWGREFRLVFPTTLAAVGLILSICAFPGIVGACKVIRRWHERQDEMLDQYPELNAYHVLRRPGVARIHETNLLFAKTSPWIFGISWILMGCLSLWLSLG